PVSYFVIAVLLVLLLLPTVLRPPQQQSNQTAELSPDAPPDKEESIIASFKAPSSATAGAGNGVGASSEGVGGDGAGAGGGGGGAGGLAPAPVGCHGWGNPPRQTESLYSAPCAPPCPTNGGATSKNVSATEVRIG